MSRFLTGLAMRDTDGRDGGKWELMAALIYESDIAKCVLVVPRGFLTDLASVPRLPVIYMLAGGAATQAAVVHDFLYSTGQFDRALADAVFREASEVTGVNWWRRWLMWAGVRLGGAVHYNG